MPTALHDKPKCRLHKRPYVEIGDNSNEEDNNEDNNNEEDGDEGGNCRTGPATGSPSSAKGKPGSTHSLAGKGGIKADPSSPAAHKDDWLSFLRGLSVDPRYIGLLDRLSHLPIYVSSIHSLSNPGLLQ